MSRMDVCVVACAELFRGDGEILASPMGPVPSLGARLARRTFEPDLVLSDGEATLLTADGQPEGWLPYRAVFDVVAHGRRHVVMGANQIDRYGNQNISCIGPHQAPKRQLLGVRGAPGNTVNHRTSYWVPKHSPRVFVPAVDVVSGVGYDRDGGPFHDVYRVVTNLCVLDFGGPGHAMRVVSVHQGVTVDEVVEQTGFPLAIDDPPVTREPTAEELAVLRELDPAR
ncbi:CoA-transferase subunit beta [Actinophytocola algeriensis]|uniref:Acyl CoA:acetate/3-ketoacid CoA transferase beta subunit n=1 Tax=Actinophytocola algeriensis TaxID=1768010 RepID=A0A7W7PZB3_9PSEU|nr:CoA-transferase [Actinophytocola algeriensis]MBB4904100.1 acyl CoA:acetate/3-ketoacid CoA transferase beta subunit [Actinophytocola algeriensis]MBE1477043.1 acyl CoA:acetate/3-ketoacid CoA transferase beta subunit [Actinophytocola algeriensis]